jgi:hypothetical protein
VRPCGDHDASWLRRSDRTAAGASRADREERRTEVDPVGRTVALRTQLERQDRDRRGRRGCCSHPFSPHPCPPPACVGCAPVGGVGSPPMHRTRGHAGSVHSEVRSLSTMRARNPRVRGFRASIRHARYRYPSRGWCCAGSGRYGQHDAVLTDWMFRQRPVASVACRGMDHTWMLDEPTFAGREHLEDLWAGLEAALGTAGTAGRHSADGSTP